MSEVTQLMHRMRAALLSPGRPLPDPCAFRLPCLVSVATSCLVPLPSSSHSIYAVCCLKPLSGSLLEGGAQNPPSPERNPRQVCTCYRERPPRYIKWKTPGAECWVCLATSSVEKCADTRTCNHTATRISWHANGCTCLRLYL